MPPHIGHPSSWCPRVKTILATFNGGNHHRIYPIRCKCWNCPFCFRKNLGQLIKQIEAAPPDRFITLTCKPHYMETPKACYHRHRPYIRKLMELARRRFGKMEYAAFCELHRSGYPHWHLLHRGDYIPQAWLSAQWQRLTGSKIVDIRKVTNARDAARYVCKYVTKSAAITKIDPQFRIVSYSRHYRPPRKEHRWKMYWSFHYERCHPLEVLKKYEDEWHIQWEDGYFAIERHYGDPWRDILDLHENDLNKIPLPIDV